jgi:hypothetical protein
MGGEVSSLLCQTERGVLNPRANSMLGGLCNCENFMSGPVRSNELRIYDAEMEGVLHNLKHKMSKDMFIKLMMVIGTDSDVIDHFEIESCVFRKC